jgi:small multidrug resistance pump
MVWLYLSIAITAEVIATTALKFSEGFTKLTPSLLVAVGYAGAFYFLSRVLEQIPISIAYAIWSGAGVALVGIVGWIYESIAPLYAFLFSGSCAILAFMLMAFWVYGNEAS